MALAQGIEGLKEGAKSFKLLGASAIKAFKGMSKGLAATGIGLFVVALGTVVAYWDDIAAAVGFGTDAIEEQEQAVRDLEKANQDNLKVMKDTVINNQRWMKRSNEIVVNEEKIKNLQAEGGDNLREINQLTQKNIENELANLQVRKESYFELLSTQEQLKLNQDIYRKQQELERNIATERKKNHDDELKRLKELEEQRKADRQRRRARFITQRDDRLAFERELEDLKLAQMVEGGEKELALLNLQYDRIREDINNNEKLNAAQKTALIIEQEKIREQELFRIRRDFFVAEKDMTLLNAKDIETAKTELIIDEEKIRDADAEERRKKRIEKGKQTALALAQITVTGLRLISDIAELNAGKDQKRAKRAFNIKKAADIAEATMSGYKAVLSTYANAPGGPILKGIAAGLAGGFAALQIGKIASAKFEGGDAGGDVSGAIESASGGAGGGGGLDTGVSSATPQFNIVGDTGLSQLAQIQQQPTQAFVVSGDVTSAQSLDRNKIQNATI